MGYDAPELNAELRPELEGVNVFEIAIEGIPPNGDAEWDRAIAALCDESDALARKWRGDLAVVFVERRLQRRSRIRAHRKFVSTLGLSSLPHVEQEVVAGSESYFIAVVAPDVDDWPVVCRAMQQHRPSFVIFGSLPDDAPVASEAGIVLVRETSEVRGEVVNVFYFRLVARMCAAGLAVGRFVYDTRYDAAAFAVFAADSMKRRFESRHRFQPFACAEDGDVV